MAKTQTSIPGLGQRVSKKPSQQNRLFWGYQQGGQAAPEVGAAPNPSPGTIATNYGGPSAGDPLGQLLARRQAGMPDAVANPVRDGGDGFAFAGAGGFGGGSVPPIPNLSAAQSATGIPGVSPAPPDYANWQSFVEQGQSPVFRPAESAVTGTPYLDRIQGGLSANADIALQQAQTRFERNREALRASLAARGLLDSGVGAQAEADLLAGAQQEMNQIAVQTQLQKDTQLQQAHQQSIDNSFKLSGLDLDINKLGLDRDKLAQGMALDDANFMVWAQQVAQESGMNIAKLFDAQAQWRAELAQRQYEFQVAGRNTGGGTPSQVRDYRQGAAPEGNQAGPTRDQILADFYARRSANLKNPNGVEQAAGSRNYQAGGGTLPQTQIPGPAKPPTAYGVRYQITNV